MTQKFSNLLKAMFVTALFSGLVVSCKDDNPNGNAGIQTEFNVTIPETATVEKEGAITITQQGGQITTAEAIYLEKDGQFFPCTVKEATEDHFSFVIPQNVETGTYKVHVRKNGKRTYLGTVVITVVDEIIEIPEGATIYGSIKTTDGQPVANAVVSDGEICTVTNAEGIYGLPSNKENGFVFVSVPSGYEPVTNGTVPKMYELTQTRKEVPEIQSFKLKKVEGQDNFKVIFMGDKHLANRTQDVVQYKKFCADVMNYKASNGGTKIYGITLGDLTWDQYWKNGYLLSNYVKTVNENIKDLIIYNVIGNHDHDPAAIGNHAAVNPMLENVAPAWYSFNIGQCHFVVLDDIDCSAYDGVKDRPYKQNIYGVQLEWLKKDLSYVDKSTPVYVMTHGSNYSYNTSVANAYNLRANTGSDELISICSSFNEVHFVNGHLHQQHTMMPADVPANTYSNKVYEHNIPAVCADWWYSGYYTPGCHVCTDGVPAGYAIFDFTGKNVKWGYKGTGMDEKILFRAYDLNNVDFSNVTWKNLKDSKVIDTFRSRYETPYAGDKRKNQVLINVWNWNSGYKIEVKTANGETLAATQINEYDPLSIAALSIPYWDRSALTSVPGTGTTKRFHFFQVQCPDADTNLEITVTDNFGNVYKETMERPKAFSTAAYSINK